MISAAGRFGRPETAEPLRGRQDDNAFGWRVVAEVDRPDDLVQRVENSLGPEGVGQQLQIFRVHADNAAARAIDIGDKEKRNGESDRKNQQQDPRALFRAHSEQEIAEKRDDHEEHPGGQGHAVAPGSLRVALRIEHVVHTGENQSRDLVAGVGDRGHRIPETGLQLRGAGIDLAEGLGVSRGVVKNTRVGVFAEELANFRSIRGRNEVRSEVLGADGVGFCFFEVLAQIVACDGHGEGETDNEAEKSEGCANYEIEILVVDDDPSTVMLMEVHAEARGKIQEQEGDRQPNHRMTKKKYHSQDPRRCSGSVLQNVAETSARKTEDRKNLARRHPERYYPVREGRRSDERADQQGAIRSGGRSGGDVERQVDVARVWRLRRSTATGEAFRGSTLERARDFEPGALAACQTAKYSGPCGADGCGVLGIPADRERGTKHPVDGKTARSEWAHGQFSAARGQEQRAAAWSGVFGFGCV